MFIPLKIKAQISAKTIVFKGGTKMSNSASDIIRQAQAWIGRKENDGSHKEIIDVYNSHRPLARGYKMTYTDPWCAAFVSAVAIKCGATDIIPTECGCEQMINLFKNMKCWIEDESITPSPGMIIFYDWQDNGVGDNRGYSDHVGIVESVKGDIITVIEGNMSDAVGRRTLKVNAKYIRGYGAPKYFTGNNMNINANAVNNNAHSVDNNLNIGDIVQLTEGATYYNGASIPSWVKKMKLYVRGFRKDGYIVISTQKTGAITGAVDKKFLKKI